MRDFLQGNMPYIACPQVPVPQPECVPPVTSVCGVWTSDLRRTSVTYVRYIRPLQASCAVPDVFDALLSTRR